MIRKLLKVAGFTLLFSGVLLILLELMARYIVKQPYYAFPEGYFISNRTYGYGLAKNFRGSYSQPEFTIAIDTNSRGLRDVELQDSSGTSVILGLGDSFSFGLGVELYETYLSRLEKMLNNNCRKGKLRVVKAGIPGYSTFNEKIFLQSEGLSYVPSWVTIQFWWDDLGVNRLVYLADTGFLTSGKINSISKIRRFMNRHLRIYAFLRRIFTVNFGKSLFPIRFSNSGDTVYEFKVKAEITVSEFKEIKNICLANKARYLFVLIPPKEFVYGYPEGEKRWNSFCQWLKQENIEYLDMLPALKNSLSTVNRVYFKVDPHLTAYGHEIVARQLLSRLSRE